MLGFKIFDSDPIDLTDGLIKLAHNEKLALEIALYGDNIEAFTQRVTQNPFYVQNKNKSIHFNYRKHVVNNIKEEKHYNNLIAEIQQAKSLLINCGVIHYQYAGHPKTHLENLTPEALRNNLTILHNVAKEYGIIFYIENTYIHQRHYFMNVLEHHRIIWDTIIELGFEDHIGMCLDWGHVKAFSGDSLTGWIDYVKELKEKGMPVYMHVHDNDAQKDLHDSLKTGQEVQYYLLNNPTDKPYIKVLDDITEYFKDDSLILEYTASIAEEHYIWTKNNISN